MASREKPLDKEMAIFVRAHLGRGVFAPFTGTDYRAWSAWCHLLRLYGSSGDPKAITALRATLECAQRKECIWEVFVQTIPGVLDWGYVKDLWPKIVEAIVPTMWPRDLLERGDLAVHHPKWMCATEVIETNEGERRRRYGLVP